MGCCPLPLTDWKPAFGWYLEGCTPTMFVEAQAMATHLDAASLTTPAACWGKETDGVGGHSHGSIPPVGLYGS